MCFYTILDNLFSMLRGLLTPVIAGIAVYIAYQQYKTNRDKVRLDLYNKRFKVFDSLKTLLGHIGQQGNVKLEQVYEFMTATKEAVFLFEEDISTYLDTISQKAFDLRSENMKLEKLPVGEERSAKVDETSELCSWLVKQSEVAVDKFNKYLKFEQKLGVKAVNWKRGLKRSTWAVSVVVGLLTTEPIVRPFVESFVGIYRNALGETLGTMIGLPTLFLIGIAPGFLGTWITYWIVWRIAQGFRDKEPRDEQDNK